MDVLFDSEQTAEWLKGFGIWGALISITLNILISVAGVLPSVFLSGVNGIVFGLSAGFVISIIGETLGALISYWLYRKGISKLRGRKGSRQGKWSRAFASARPAKQFVLMLIARIMPFIPSGAITFAASWYRMNVYLFMAATVIGKAPSIAAEVWLGQGLFYWIKNSWF
ncbi:TVP38/TMEM64 family protein [Paenibacillus sp. CAU 1782]